jgi:hypothetical protein
VSVRLPSLEVPVSTLISVAPDKQTAYNCRQGQHIRNSRTEGLDLGIGSFSSCCLPGIVNTAFGVEREVQREKPSYHN